MDEFRAVAYLEGGAWPVGIPQPNALETFESLAQPIGQEFYGRTLFKLTGRRLTGVIPPPRWSFACASS
jgi:hypothetical protein